MSAAGSELLDRWLAGDREPLLAQAQKLHDQLIRAGLVHPVPIVPEPLPSIAFVVPVYQDAVGLDQLLTAVRDDHPDAPIIVIDDASPNGDALVSAAERHGAELIRHAINQGPAAARNTGWRRIVDTQGVATIRPEVVVFVDADVVPHAHAVQLMIAHFSDPGVAMVAPRIAAAPGVNVIAAYESDNSPLDMGEDTALVYPGTRLSYVPSAMLAVRCDVLEQARGFDEAMRYGEDVDLVWRIIHDGHLVRFEPTAVAEHRNRSSLRTLARQRFAYGSSAAALAARHGDNVAPLQLPAATVAATLAMLFGRPWIRLAGLTAAAASVIPLARKLDGKVDESTQEALRLTAMTHGYAVHGLATAATRSWAPLLLVASPLRRALAGALVVPALIDWMRTRPAIDPVRHVALRAIDHGSYCAGVWSGVVRSRSFAALLPRIRLRHEAR